MPSTRRPRRASAGEHGRRAACRMPRVAPRTWVSAGASRCRAAVRRGDHPTSIGSSGGLLHPPYGRVLRPRRRRAGCITARSRVSSEGPPAPRHLGRCPRMFSKILIANRGEIAVRIIRALDELGVASVAVYSELDRDAPHVARAGESYLLGPAAPAASYLNIARILDVVRQSGAEAVHPGYGFLAENAAFARACEDAGVVFIGPPASAIDAMGSKTRAREIMRDAGVPIVPGTTDPVESVDEARRIIDASIGYPVAIKAAGGGGGKGFRVAESEDALEKAFEGAAREGEKFFSDSTVYIERYLPDPRHVEVQILADAHGNVI